MGNLDYSPEYFDFMDKNYPKGYSYQEFAKDFTAEFFDPDEWAELFKKAGARYIFIIFLIFVNIFVFCNYLSFLINLEVNIFFLPISCSVLSFAY